MPNISESIESVLEGVKGLANMAEGYLAPASDNGEASVPPPGPQSQPLHIPSSHRNATSKFALPQQSQLVQTIDVPSGWIHLQAAYLDGDGGQRQVRPFGLRNLTEEEVEVEVESDLKQLLFWASDDEKSKFFSFSGSYITRLTQYRHSIIRIIDHLFIIYQRRSTFSPNNHSRLIHCHPIHRIPTFRLPPPFPFEPSFTY